MPSPFSRLSSRPAATNRLLYITENQRDAEFLASQFDCQVVVQPRVEPDASLVSETSRRFERSNFWAIPNADDGKTLGTLKRLDA